MEQVSFVVAVAVAVVGNTYFLGSDAASPFDCTGTYYVPVQHLRVLTYSLCVEPIVNYKA